MPGAHNRFGLSSGGSAACPNSGQVPRHDVKRRYPRQPLDCQDRTDAKRMQGTARTAAPSLMQPWEVAPPRNGSATAGECLGGVRPSSGAAMLESNGDAMKLGASGNSVHAAPEDGRTPPTSPPPSLRDYAAAVFGIDGGPAHDTVYIYSMSGLTRRQQQILDFIQKWQRTEGTTPTFQEIADQFGFRSLNSVTEHVRLLRQKGVLATDPGKARSLRVISPLTKLRGRIADIPLFGSIPAGLPQAREQEAEGCVSVDIESIGFKPSRNSFALRITGDSMIGRHVLAGDVVVLEHGPEPRNGQVVAALIDGESTLKTFVLKGGRPFLRAENPKYPDLIPAQELMIQGVFKALIRKARE